MADSILRLKVESQEYDNKLKQAAQGLNRYADECRKVGGTLEVVEKETLDYVRALGQMDTTSRTATGKLAEMKKTFTELSAQYKQMTDAEKQSPFGKALAASLDQLKTRIQEGKSQLDDINKSINGGGGLTGALDAVAGKFGLNIDQVTKFGGVVGVATTAVQVAKDAFFQSESGIDEWGRTVEGAKGAYSVFLDTLNNGNWSNFFQNLSAAIQGGRDLYDVFDRLGSIKSNNAAAIAITQKEIAELRLAKQQGENVDAKLKAATERLASLQKQSVSAGMAAGSQSAFQTIRNGVNSVGGAGVNDATIKYVVDKIMKGGQSEFDKYKRNYETLQQRGMVTRTQTINDSQGGTYERQYRVFDINALTKEQQKQYTLAKAITEGETRIQKGISAYAQAVSEGTASAREEFKGNRYAIQGAGGRGGSGGSSSSKSEQTFAPDSIAAQEKMVQDLNKAWREAGSGVRDSYIPQIVEAEAKLKEMRDQQALMKEQAQGKLLGGSVSTEGIKMGSFAFDGESLQKNLDYVLDQIKVKPIVVPLETTKNNVEGIKEAAKATAKVVGTIGNAFNAIEDPAAKVAGTVAQAIANIALAYSDALGKTVGEKFNIWSFIAASAAAMVSMGTTIASIHQATGYAQGGMIKGNSYSGDNIGGLVDGSQLVGLNAGELVLTKAQQSNLANSLQGNGGNTVRVVGKIAGKDLFICAENWAKSVGKGEFVTW